MKSRFEPALETNFPGSEYGVKHISATYSYPLYTVAEKFSTNKRIHSDRTIFLLVYQINDEMYSKPYVYIIPFVKVKEREIK